MPYRTYPCLRVQRYDFILNVQSFWSFFFKKRREFTVYIIYYYCFFVTLSLVNIIDTRDMEKQKDISVIVPLWNEDESLRPLHEWI